MKYHGNTVIYAINISDVQTVSSRTLKRALTDEEIDSVQESVGDFIDWFHAIESAIHKHVDQQESVISGFCDR
jgi:hypothetical protein